MRNRSARWRWPAIVVLALLPASCGRDTPPLVLATTTSVANSGLLDRVLPGYPHRRVRTVQAGSGRALEMLAGGTADVVISHAPERERQMLGQHPAWFYRKVLHNDFLIVGPAADPARIDGLGDAVGAMKRIADAGARFLSRGDESGTHERERQLWKSAGVLASSHIVVAGAGMGQTLRVASETGAYTLTDRGTYEALAGTLKLRILVSGDARLLNTYAVVADPTREDGMTFARWLAEGGGREALAVVLRSGEIRGFSIWPTGRDGTRPEALPF